MMAENQKLHEKYLLEIVREFDTNHRIIEAPEQGCMERYYASLQLDELSSRLRYHVAWYENRKLSSPAYEEARRRVAEPKATSPNCI